MYKTLELAADLDARGVRQINRVCLHTMGLRPIGLAAGAGVKMTLLRLDDAAVATRQAPQAGITVPLIEAFACLAPAGNAMDRAGVTEREGLAEQGI